MRFWKIAAATGLAFSSFVSGTDTDSTRDVAIPGITPQGVKHINPVRAWYENPHTSQGTDTIIVTESTSVSGTDTDSTRDVAIPGITPQGVKHINPVRAWYENPHTSHETDTIIVTESTSLSSPSEVMGQNLERDIKDPVQASKESNGLQVAKRQDVSPPGDIDGINRIIEFAEKNPSRIAEMLRRNPKMVKRAMEATKRDPKVMEFAKHIYQRLVSRGTDTSNGNVALIATFGGLWVVTLSVGAYSNYASYKTIQLHTGTIARQHARIGRLENALLGAGVPDPG